MIRFFQALMPREDKFFGLFDQHARTLVQGAQALRDLLEGGDSASPKPASASCITKTRPTPSPAKC